MLALAVAMGIGRFAFTPILPAMHDAQAIPTVTLGALASVNYLGYLVGAIAAVAVRSGAMVNRVFRASLLIVVIVTGLMAVTTHVPVWFVLRFVAGAASAGVFVCASAMVLQRTARSGRPVLAGRFFAGVGIGIALSGLVVLGIVHFTGDQVDSWRWQWVAVALLAVVLTVPSLVWLTPAAAADSPPPARLTTSPKRRSRWLPIVLLGTAYFLEGIGYIIAGTFLVAIVAAGPQSATAATMAWVVVGLAAAPSALAWAWLARRLSLMTALALAYVAQAVGLLLTGPDGVWLAAAVLFGGTFVGITSLTITGSRDLVDPRQATRTIAILTAIFGLGQILGPLLATALAETTADLGRAMPFAAGLVLLGAVLVVAAGRVSQSVGTA